MTKFAPDERVFESQLPPKNPQTRPFGDAFAKREAVRRSAWVALLWGLGCSQVAPKADDTASGGTSSSGAPAPYLGAWHMMGTVTTTCSDGTSANQPLAGTVSITRGTTSDLLRTVADGSCTGFPLKVQAANATLVASVACPAQAASQVTVTSWQVTLGVDDSSATETGSAKTVFPPPETGMCTSIYGTTLVK